MPFKDWLHSDESKAAKKCALSQAFDEGGAKARATLEEYSVQYLTEEERKEYLVHFIKRPSNTLFFQQGLKANRTYMFVMDKDDHFYAGKLKVSHFHHSSFLAGGPVKSAGEFTVDERWELKKITNRSGHYQPTEVQMLNTLTFLHEKGVDLSKVTLDMVQLDGRTYHVYNNALTFLISDGNCEPDQIK